jgi:hypothetical protein
MSGYMGGAQGSSPPPTVVLAPGKSASAVLEWDDAPSGGQSTNSADCPGPNSVSLLVTPPNTQTTSTFPSLQDACQGFTIHPVVPGSTGQGWKGLDNRTTDATAVAKLTVSRPATTVRTPGDMAAATAEQRYPKPIRARSGAARPTIPDKATSPP